MNKNIRMHFAVVLNVVLLQLAVAQDWLSASRDEVDGPLVGVRRRAKLAREVEIDVQEIRAIP